MRKPAKEPLDSWTTAERMRRLRKAFGPSQTAFCARYGFKVQQWSNFENGRPVGKRAALQLVRQIPDISLDWIYLGNTSGLRIEIARRLGELPPLGRESA